MFFCKFLSWFDLKRWDSLAWRLPVAEIKIFKEVCCLASYVLLSCLQHVFVPQVVDLAGQPGAVVFDCNENTKVRAKILAGMLKAAEQGYYGVVGELLLAGLRASDKQSSVTLALILK